MKRFYILFPNTNALRSQLTWTHYRALLRVEDDKARNWYLEECVRSGWSSRQLERQISTLYYDRLLCGGIWCIIQLEYNNENQYEIELESKKPQKSRESIIGIRKLTPIQMPAIDVYSDAVENNISWIKSGEIAILWMKPIYKESKCQAQY